MTSKGSIGSRLGAGCAAALAFLVGVWAAPAGAQPLAVLRLESLDAAHRDAQTLARSAGREIPREVLVQTLAETFGVEDVSSLDWGRPLVVVLPVEGMMMMQQGLVALVPVRDPETALRALAPAAARHRVEGDLHVYELPEGPVLYVATGGGYLRLGLNRDLVTGVDAAAALAPWHGLGGSCQLQVFLEPVMPIIQATLVQAKEQIRTQLRSQADPAPGGPAAPFDPRALGEITDLYLDAVRQVVAQVSRVQVALGVEAEHLRYRKRIVPKVGTAFAELAGAQKGGLPDVAARVPPALPVVAAGQVMPTLALRAALRDLADRYVAAAARLVTTTAAADGAPEAPEVRFWRWYLGLTNELLGRSLACPRGDLAAAATFAEGGISFVEVFGHTGAPACSGLVRDVVDRLREAPGKEVGRLVRVEELPPVDGTPVYRVRVDPEVVKGLGVPPDAGPDAPGEEAFRALYGDVMNVLLAASQELYYYAAGRQADGQLRRLMTAPSPGGGLSPESFRPLVVGPGYFSRFDVGAILEGVRASLPAGVEEAEDLGRAARALSGGAGRIVVGLGLDAPGATFDAAVPLRAVEALSSLNARTETEAVPDAPSEDQAL